MIQSLDIKIPNECHFSWLPKIPALAKPKKFEFQPGINILWGRNGSGKSTVMNLMADLLHCRQSGTTCITGNSITDIRRYNRPIKEVVDIVHDGQSVRHFDPNHSVGLVGGMAGFDDDFFSMGVRSAMFKGSSGQTTMFKMDTLLHDIAMGRVPSIEHKAKHVSDDIKKYLVASCEVGQPTIIMDEPDRSLDVIGQLNFWSFIRAFSSRCQFIIAAHSFFALDIPNAKYIEFDDRYLLEGLFVLEQLKKWRDAKVPDPEIINKKAIAAEKAMAKK